MTLSAFFQEYNEELLNLVYEPEQAAFRTRTQRSIQPNHLLRYEGL